MSNSVQLYTNIAAPQSSFSFPFSYLEAVDITAYVDGVVVFQNNASTGTAVGGNTYVVAFSAPDSTTLTFSPAVVAGSDVRIQRNTDLVTKAVDFADGAVLTELALDTAIDQVFFGSQEAIDKANDSVTVDTDDKWNAQNKTIKNVANPVDPQDVATKDYLENTWLSPTDKTNLTTVSNISSDVTATAGIASDITAVASDATDIGVVSTNIASVNTNAGSIASINTNAANIADIQNASANATTATTKASEASGFADEAEAWAIKIDGEAVASEGYSSKAWAVGGTGVTDTAGAGPAKDWATETTGQVDGTEYSAKEYAVGAQSSNTSGSAKQWSLGGGTGFDRDTAVTGSGLTAEYSARYWANQAANSAQDFVDVYYGSFTSDTAAEDYQINDNQGSVNVGDLYFNSSDNVMRVRSFSGWNDVAADTTNFATNGFAIAMAIAL